MNTALIPIKSFICGKWHFGNHSETVIHDSYTGQAFCQVSSKGIDFKDVLAYGRKYGCPALTKMTFPQRGLMLKKLAFFLLERKELFYELSYRTGATRRDAWIDIEGGIGNLFSYASLRRHFNDTYFMTEGDDIPLSNDRSFSACHVLVPKHGVALHINAFNFPVWGMLEKIAVNLLAGVPAVVKPATSSCYLTELVTKSIIESGIVPEGSLQLICGSVGDIFDHLTCQDTVTFTGSFQTGSRLKIHPRIVSESIPFNMEADSLNCTILAQDVEPNKSPEFDLFIRQVIQEITVKCGQKCTAIRRILVPRKLVEAVSDALMEKLDKIHPENPRSEKARMGSLISREQANDVLEKVEELKTEAQVLLGGNAVNTDIPTVMHPVLLYQDKPINAVKVHAVEAFGPVATILPYDSDDEAVFLANQGKGSLCCSLVTADPKKAVPIVLGCGRFHGRILILNQENQKTSTGHGSPLPLLVHGGPGRSGGGEEMGGLRGVKHYLQRFSLQASPSFLTAVTDVYHLGGTYKIEGKHPFRKFFEELEIGETLITHKRTFTEADISNFSNLTWDHFHAHTDHTSLENTIFEKPVVHGYLVLSAAAGLFVDPVKGNVLLNYGMEDCRFIKPVYAGDTICVHLTVKSKTPRDQKESDLCPQGTVQFLVQVYDQHEDLVAVANILTMVRAKEELRTVLSTN